MRPSSSDQARALLLARAPEWEAEWSVVLDQEWTIAIHDGSLILEGPDDWSPQQIVIVDGDLRLPDGLITSADDALLVLGDVDCELAVLGGEVLVTGALRARTWVYASSSNDYALTVGGTLQAKAFVEEGMASCAGSFAASVFSTHNTVVQIAPRLQFPRRSLTLAEATAAGLSPQDVEALQEYAGLTLS